MSCLPPTGLKGLPGSWKPKPKPINQCLSFCVVMVGASYVGSLLSLQPGSLCEGCPKEAILDIPVATFLFLSVLQICWCVCVHTSVNACDCVCEHMCGCMCLCMSVCICIYWWKWVPNVCNTCMCDCVGLCGCEHVGGYIYMMPI